MREPGQRPARVTEARNFLVGREREMGVLVDALESARSGAGRLVLLTGEAGIGKTRLADAFAGEARGADARVLWGRCWEAGGAPAYWPWLQAIRAYLRDGDPVAVRRALGSGGPHLARILPELRDLLPDLPELGHEESDEARFQVFEAAATFLRNVSAARPLVLILDDVHAADEPSLRLLQFLAADISDSRLLAIATYREKELAHGDPRPGLLADVGRSPAAQRLALGGLSEPDVSRYIELTISTTPPPGLADAVHRETEGNPLFVGEVVRLLAEEGRLERAHGAIGRPFGIPEGVRAVIGRRLERLSGPCRELLSRASVIGVEVPLDLLARLEERPAEALLDLLDEGAAARVLEEPPSPGGRWRFGHALIREVLYAALPASTRIRLHRRIGEMLEALHGDDQQPPLAELAHHYLAAASGRKAVEYARRAAERAVELSAYEESVRLYRLALEAGELEELERCHLLLGLGQAAMRSGDQAGMRKAFLEGAAIAERLGLAEELAQAAVGYGGQLVHRRAGDDDQLVPLLERALGALSLADGPLRVRLLARLAGALRDQPTMDRRAALSAEAVAMARRLGDPVTLGYALQSRHSAIWGPDALTEMAALLDEIDGIAIAVGDRERLAENHWSRTVALATIGAAADVFRAEIEAGARLARELRQPALLWYHVQWRAAIALNEGRLGDAEALLQEVRRTGDRAVPWDADYAFRVGLFLVRREQGRLDEVVEQVRQAVDDFPGYRLLSCFAAYVEAATGREASARRVLDELARDDFAFLPRDLGWPFGMVFLGETALLLGDRPRAADTASALLPYGELFATASGVFPAGPVGRMLGLLAADAGQLDEALERLDRATRACARTGSRLWETRSIVERANILVRRGRPGDRDLARQLLGPALETCRELGLVAIQRQAEAVLSDLDPEEPGEQATSGSAAPGEAIFRRDGDYWAIDFGRLIRLRDAKGLRYLAVLLASPRREFHALDLVARLGPANGSPPRLPHAGALGLRPENAGAIVGGIDEQARSAYRTRLRELQAELDEAESFNDPARGERAQAEIGALEAELSGAFGLGGRARAVGSPAERARQSVTKAIRDALRRIELEDAALGDHLARSIHTGLFCVYDPDPAATPHWRM